MKERPILFSAPMVRAILTGNKTQTRRIAKLNSSGRVELAGKNWHLDDCDALLACPYGQPGDQLWVRETFMQIPHPSDLGITEKDIPHTWAHACAAAGSIYYRADPFSDLLADDRAWKPSIFMPRAASRIQLEITAVRVERLNDISGGDAIAEGVSVHADHHAKPVSSIYSPIAAYRDLWESINGEGSWAVNPLVWVVEFRVLKGGAA